MEANMCVVPGSIPGWALFLFIVYLCLHHTIHNHSAHQPLRKVYTIEMHFVSPLKARVKGEG